MNGLIGRKLGMTRVFDAAGTHVPVTVIAEARHGALVGAELPDAPHGDEEEGRVGPHAVRAVVVQQPPRGPVLVGLGVAPARAVQRRDVLQRHEDVPVQLEMCDVLDQLAEAGVFFLILSGGEVLMRRDFFQILAHARALLFSVKGLTSAIRNLIRDPLIPTLNEVKAAVQDVRGTAEFVTDTAVHPLIRVVSVGKGIKRGVSVASGLGRRRS